jgi:hypothetical protein
MRWIVQNNLFAEQGFKPLLQALKQLQIPYSLHKVIPFVGELDPDPGQIEGPVVVMGSYSMGFYAQRMGWTPGTFANDNHDFRAQLPHWGGYMLNSDAKVMKFADVQRTRKLFFIRPVDDSKCFAGHVSSWGQYRVWRDRVMALGADNGSTVTGDTLVIVSQVREIHREWRTWVVDSEVVTASLYKERGRAKYVQCVDERIVRFVQSFLGGGRWEPARAYVIDVAETDDGLSILECNNINAAGWYAADVQKLVVAIDGMNGY